MTSFNSRFSARIPPCPPALTRIEQQARHWFLEAGRTNQNSKRCFGTERDTWYVRKCGYIRLALQLDPSFTVILVTTLEPLCPGHWLVGLRLRHERVIGVHFPVAETDPLFAVLAARGHRRSA